jgi:hypothetical protein
MYAICCVLWYYSSALLHVHCSFKRSHANHSIRASLIVAGRGYHVHNLLRAAVLQQCAAAIVHAE